MYDDVLGIAFGGTAGTGGILAATGDVGSLLSQPGGEVLAQTGGEVGPLLLVAWGLAFGGTMVLAGVARVKARLSR